MHKTHLLVMLFTLNSCGGGDAPMAPTGGKSAEASAEPSKVDPELTVDLAKLGSAELQELAEALRKRNESEKIEVETLKALNPKLCARLKSLRESCKIAIPIITDEAASKLECGDGTNTAPNKISVNIDADGKYEMVADNLFKSQTFERGTHEVRFVSATGGAVTSNPKLVDVRKLVLRRTDGGAPNPGFVLSLSVNGSEVLNGQDLTRAATDTLQFQLVKFMDQAESCHISAAELQTLRASVTPASAKKAEPAAKPAPAKPTAEPTANPAPVMENK